MRASMQRIVAGCLGNYEILRFYVQRICGVQLLPDVRRLFPGRDGVTGTVQWDVGAVGIQEPDGHLIGMKNGPDLRL